MIVTRFSQLINSYHELGPGDVFVGRVPSSYLKATLLTDLTDRGVHLLPSATAQLLNGSKVAQAFVLSSWMVPHTLAITRRKELLDALTLYQREGITTVVTKSDRLHCGHGISKWDSLETLYGWQAHNRGGFPFVLQPFVTLSADVRVIVVGDFCESYSRFNRYNFRMNLAAGGQSRPYKLTPEQRGICAQVMARAQMPFAHVDLMIMDDGAIYLSEISLNGGIRGAQVDRLALKQMKKRHLMVLAQQIIDSSDTQSSPTLMETAKA